MDISAKEKIEITRLALKQLCQAIYSQVISKRVGDKVGDEKISNAAISELERLEKMKDEYEAILKENENQGIGK